MKSKFYFFFITFLASLFFFGCASFSAKENYDFYTESEVNYYQKVNASSLSASSISAKEYELKIERLQNER